MPLARRLPKRGFNNIFATPMEIINLNALNAFEDGETVTAEALLAKGILSKCEYGFKGLGNQEGHGSGFCFLRFCQGGYRGSWRKGRGEVK